MVLMTPIEIHQRGEWLPLQCYCFEPPPYRSFRQVLSGGYAILISESGIVWVKEKR